MAHKGYGGAETQTIPALPFPQNNNSYPRISIFLAYLSLSAGITSENLSGVASGFSQWKMVFHCGAISTKMLGRGILRPVDVLLKGCAKLSVHTKWNGLRGVLSVSPRPELTSPSVFPALLTKVISVVKDGSKKIRQWYCRISSAESVPVDSRKHNQWRRESFPSENHIDRAFPKIFTLFERSNRMNNFCLPWNKAPH